MHDEPGSHVLFFDDIDEANARIVGGKAAHLAALSRMDGVLVPPGFCVTTDAFDRILAEASLDDLLARLARVKGDDRDAIASLSAEARHAIGATPVPPELADAIARAVTRLGEQHAVAVRSSATAEDLPTASFAGQQDTYLDVVGTEAVLAHVRECWASLFTERAVSYRVHHGFDHRRVRMAVVVQRMVPAEASGVLFTADPVTGHRKVSSIEAVFGLGESLVSGRVNADVCEVRDETVVRKKTIAQPVLTDAQVVRLSRLGRSIEARFGRPQDIEWCLAADEFHIVQSRPITTLFPLPARSDGENRVYLSVGHQQMMTDAMKALGISVWKRIAVGAMHEAGGRVFVDVTETLASPTRRPALLEIFRKSEPLTADAVQTILDRGDFIRELPAGPPPPPPPPPIEANAALVTELVARTEASLAAANHAIRGRSGAALLDFILADIEEAKRVLFAPETMQVVQAAVRATWWLNENIETWLGEKSAADTLAQSVPGNVTSEMGLALLDVADAIRPHPEVVAFLERVQDDSFVDALGELPGGPEARAAIDGWLEKYGMRCPGEIDITRPRFRERPTMLLPTLLSSIRTIEPGAAARRFEQGRQEAEKKERDILERLRALPDGEQKATETKAMIDRLRTFMGYREYPKYGIVSRTFVYKLALLEEAERLVRANVLREKEDIFHLGLEELHDVVRTGKVDEALLRERKEAFVAYAALTPPRVLTSDGESVTGTYRREDLPPGALVGLAVSAGTIEGRARVILDIAKAELEAGDILVTKFTDPSWTPAFVTIRGLVTEVGGLMTHGAVIAREYGLPAVVGVDQATTRIRDGQRIRVNGTDGYVEILA